MDISKQFLLFKLFSPPTVIYYPLCALYYVLCYLQCQEDVNVQPRIGHLCTSDLSQCFKSSALLLCWGSWNTQKICCWLFCNCCLRSIKRSCSIILSLLSELVSVNEAYLALTVSTSALVGSGVSSSLCTHVFIFPFCLPLRIAILKAISLLWFYVKLCTTGQQVLGKQVKVFVFKVLSMGAARPPSLKLGVFSIWGN